MNHKIFSTFGLDLAIFLPESKQYYHYQYQQFQEFWELIMGQCLCPRDCHSLPKCLTNLTVIYLVCVTVCIYVYVSMYVCEWVCHSPCVEVI